MTIQITAKAGDLRRAIDAASQICNRRNTIPILGHVLLRRSADGLEVVASDMEVQLAQQIAGGFAGPGGVGITFNPRRILPALQAAHDAATVVITASGSGHVEISAQVGLVHLTMPGLPDVDFPIMPSPDPIATIGFGSTTLLHLIRTVIHAISTEETRYYLNGVYFHRVRDQLCAVATDGHRLMLQHANAPEGTPDSLQAIVPTPAVRMLQRLLSPLVDAPAQVQADVFGADHVRIVFSGPGWSLRTKLIDGTFPNYERVMPKGDLPGRWTVHNPADISALLAALAADADRAEPIAIRPAEGGGAMVIADHVELGRAVAHVPPQIASWSGPICKGASFQARYLRDLCDALPAGFAMDCDLEAGPAMIRDHFGAAVGAIMPMRMPSGLKQAAA